MNFLWTPNFIFVPLVISFGRMRAARHVTKSFLACEICIVVILNMFKTDRTGWTVRHRCLSFDSLSFSCRGHTLWQGRPIDKFVDRFKPESCLVRNRLKIWFVRNLTSCQISVDWFWVLFELIYAILYKSKSWTKKAIQFVHASQVILDRKFKSPHQLMLFQLVPLIN